jgi:hypothetical protein
MPPVRALSKSRPNDSKPRSSSNDALRIATEASCQSTRSTTPLRDDFYSLRGSVLIRTPYFYRAAPMSRYCNLPLTCVASCILPLHLISSAYSTGASGLFVKTSTIPSPVGKRVSFPSASAARNCSVSQTIWSSSCTSAFCSSISSFEYPTMSRNKICPSSR